ncbi:class I SAM-dependent methyltransferase [Pararhodospirillum oryzae]|uniref:Methyltransferase n=1 Tax=Pararhodospirillum oryzae TaxID=478448 RepID=A0A512H519_9PROT|nr:class I SAM-dependent methyltransferase [Pararhodospirillum oryzae]GEO80537.1 hypothetical protein ROR02_06680 [Pararhodospirillum oryzae]
MGETITLSIHDIPQPDLVNEILWSQMSQHLRTACMKPVDGQTDFQPLPYTAGQLLGRLGFALGYYDARLTNLFRWAAGSAEGDNFTYALTPRNKRHLAAFVALVTRRPAPEIEGYLDEIENDQALRTHFQTVLKGRQGPMDQGFHPGRRMGWYAVARALKPRVVIETGVHTGHGSITLAAALMRNQAEGFPGRYYGTDIAPAAGILFQGPYAEMGTILYGDSLESLKKLDGPIDLFINDSDHSATYEREEYRVIEPKLSAHAVVLGDNAHVSDSLLEHARETGRTFLFFREDPINHWYPGAGIGAMFPTST